MIHHGGMRARGERAPSLVRSTMMNHGIISNHVILDNIYSITHHDQNLLDGSSGFLSECPC
jgi:hypothetical protein